MEAKLSGISEFVSIGVFSLLDVLASVIGLGKREE